MAPIIVVGAGVIGLQTAIILLEAGHKVAIIAKHWPGDKSIEYTSPWAGAIWRTHATALEPEQCEWGLENYKALLDVAKNDLDKANSMGVMQCQITVYSSGDDGGDHWYEHDVQNFAMLDPTNVPTGGPKSGHTFLTTAINPSTYLDHLLGQAKQLGVQTITAELPTSNGFAHALTIATTLVRNIDDFKTNNEEVLVVNCTGLGAKSLVGDENMYPLRGQTLLARVHPPPAAREIVLWDTPEFVSHIVPRPGTDYFLIGGTKDADNWDPNPTPEIKEVIVQRIKKLLAGLEGEKEIQVEVLADQVGLRPSRRGGPRVETEKIDIGKGKSVNVVHCYGHGGAGYVNALGSANKVNRLVNQILGS